MPVLNDSVHVADRVTVTLSVTSAQRPPQTHRTPLHRLSLCDKGVGTPLLRKAVLETLALTRKLYNHINPPIQPEAFLVYRHASDMSNMSNMSGTIQCLHHDC